MDPDSWIGIKKVYESSSRIANVMAGVQDEEETP